jgi:hypothetical protein
MDMKFGTWNMRSLYRCGSFTTEARELATYRLDLVCVLEFRWDKGGTLRTDDYTFIYVKRNENLQLETVFFEHHRISSAVKTAVFY